MLIELVDVPGALERALAVFSKHGVNLTHIESRPVQGDCFDFYVDCEGRRGNPAVEAVIAELGDCSEKLMVLDDKSVPWFPRHISELDLVVDHTLKAGIDLASDHPGFQDDVYRQRRAMIETLAFSCRVGDLIPHVDYTKAEMETWQQVFGKLEALHEQYACAEYRRSLQSLRDYCGFGPDQIPQGQEVSAFLKERTGFQLRPVAGLLSARDFLNGLGFRVFFSTQYIRHGSVPHYTPEPDICHEMIGHVPMFADPAFADLSQEIGLASLGATDAEIERLARCYWFAVEFGLVRENGQLKACGAGLLSSPGELRYACEGEADDYRDWQPQLAAETDYPITAYQPGYFVAGSLEHLRLQMKDYVRDLQRPFYARYNPATCRIWVDRAVRREAP
jgi:phenylalanine-4-hydroxylase